MNSRLQTYRSLSLSPLLVALLVLLVCATFCAATASSSVSELTELSLDELSQVKVLKVYGASRYEQKALEAPANVTVITAEAIRRFGYRTLADALRSVTGIYVSNDRVYEYAGYRGMSLPGDYNTRVLVMIDGVRLNDGVYHQAPIGYDVPLDISLVERIEVIRGPSQAIYGNNAFMLVINVITRQAPSKASLEAGQYADTRGQFKTVLTGGGTVDDAGVLVSGSFFNAAGSRLYFPEYNAPATNNGVSDRGADASSGGSAYLKVDYERLAVSLGYMQARKHIPSAAWGTTFNDSQTLTNEERFFANLSVKLLDGESASLQFRSGLNAYNYNGVYAYTPAPESRDFSRALTLTQELLGTVRLSDEHRLVAGTDYRYGVVADQGDTLGFHDSRQVTNIGLFMQHEYRPFKQLLLFGGLRYDYLGQGLDTLNPKAGIVVLPMDDLAVKYLWGRSFRSPNAFERYYYGNGYRSNPNLQEETQYSHELILEYLPSDDLRLTVTGFQYTYNDLITQVLAQDGTFSFQNTEEYRTRGVEVEAAGRLNQWSGGVGYTYQTTRCLVHHEDSISNSPANLLKLRLSRELIGSRLVLSGEYFYTSRLVTVDSATNVGEVMLVNLSIVGRDLLLKGVESTIAVYNLFNRQYTQPGANEHLPVTSIPQDGRTVSCKLTYRF